MSLCFHLSAKHLLPSCCQVGANGTGEKSQQMGFLEFTDVGFLGQFVEDKPLVPPSLLSYRKRPKLR